MMARNPSPVVMVGTALETHGGISAVIDTWRRAGLFERWPVDYVASHRDGLGIEKFLKAVDGYAMFLALLCRYPRALLHVHSASRRSFWRKSVFMALALLARWPVVFHLHGGGFGEFYEQECGPLRRALVRFFLGRAACIVVVSERWAAWMKGVTRNPRIAVIPNGIALPPPAAQPRESALVLFHGRCCEGKGIYDLLQAMLALRREFPRVRLDCAGDGEVDEVERSVAALGLADRVRVHGWIGPGQRDEFLARATVFVLPSHAEGLPMALLEAMAAGCPVVASAVGGIPDVVTDGVNGLLVPPGDPRALQEAIARVLADPALAARLGRCARETVAARYTAARSVERVEQIYESMGTVPLSRMAERLSPQELQ